MPITKTYTLYTFDELTNQAKEKARDWFRSSQGSEDFMLLESFAQTLDFWGFPEGSLKIHYSLSYCQGDGVAFEGRLDFDALLATKDSELAAPSTDAEAVRLRDLITQARSLGMELYGEIEHRGPYTHECSMRIDIDFSCDDLCIDADKDSNREGIYVLLQTALAKYVEARSLELKNDGYDEIEFQQANEQVDDSILANEYTFREDGTRMN